MGSDTIAQGLAINAQNTANQALILSQLNTLLSLNPNPNLLTANQTSCGNVLNNSTGFSGNQGTESIVDPYSNPLYLFNGMPVLRVTTPGNVAGEGIRINPTISKTSPIALAFIAVVWVPLNVTAQVALLSADQAHGLSKTFIGKGQWQIVTGTTNITSGYTSETLLITTQTTAIPTNLYVAMLCVREGMV